MKPLEMITKWRRLFTCWQCGESHGTPERDAVRDAAEARIMYRVELSALAALLVQKGVFTAVEFTAQCEIEAEELNKIYSKAFPGIRADETGLVIDMPVGLATAVKYRLIHP